MANYKAVIYVTPKLSKLNFIDISGTVTVDGLPEIRTILVYKNNDVNLLTQGTSESDGTFLIKAQGGSNDLFRVICIGGPDENSQIFDHLQQAV